MTGRAFGAGDLPAVCWWHPGGFTQGAASWGDRHAAAHVHRGVGFVSLPYRLAGNGVTVLDQLTDARAGLAWATGRFGRIVLGGHSAGGLLAALLAATSVGSTDESATIAGVVLLAPVPRLPERFRALAGDPPDLTQLDPGSLVVAGAPPLRIVHGDADDIVPVEGSTSLIDCWTAVDAPASLEVIAGADHFFNRPEHATAAEKALAAAAAELLLG